MDYLLPLIVGLLSVEICRFVGHKIVFTFPESVPTAVTNFVNSLLPLAANIIIIIWFKFDFNGNKWSKACHNLL